MSSEICVWCGKTPKKFGWSGFEQQDTSGKWKPLCLRCKSHRDRIFLSGNPFAGMLIIKETPKKPAMTSLQAFKTEIERLDREATPSPWFHTAITGGWDGVTDLAGRELIGLKLNHPPNARFAASARQLLPDLLALAEDLQARLSVAEDESSSSYRQLGELTRLCNVLTNELPPTVLSTEGEIARKAIRSYIESVGVPTAALAEIRREGPPFNQTPHEPTQQP